MHIRVNICSCGDDGLNDKLWGSTYRNLQTLMSSMNMTIPSVVKLLEFFTKLDKIKNALDSTENVPDTTVNLISPDDLILEPSEVSTWLLCEHGIFTKNVLLRLYPGKWVGKVTHKEVYKDNEINIEKFLDLLVATKNPVIINSNDYSYIIIDIIKSKYTASLQIGDPLASGKIKRKKWVSAHTFLARNNSWMCLFIE